MTKKELTDWITSCDLVDSDAEYDSCGNCYAWYVYSDREKLFRVSFCNGHPQEVLGKRGYIRGVYEPEEVVKKVEVVEHVSYKPTKPGESFYLSDVGELFVDSSHCGAGNRDNIIYPE